jgi:hypothetical protein
MNNSLVTVGRRTALLLAALVCLSMSLLVTHPAFAATVPASAHAATQINPLASGGGCYPAYNISSCISENSSQHIVPDAYANGSTLCNVYLYLILDGRYTGYYTSYTSSNCYPSGYHFWGPQGFNGVAGHSWYTLTCADVVKLSGRYCVGSYVLYT